MNIRAQPSHARLAIVVTTAALVVTGCGAQPQGQEAQTTQQVAVATSAPAQQPQPTQAQVAASPAATSAPKQAQAAGQPSKRTGPARPEDVNGQWCPVKKYTPESQCVTVKLPYVTYADGTRDKIVYYGPSLEGGKDTIQYDLIDAPLGVFYPAGVPIPPLPVNASPPGFKDDPSVDRIWEQQSYEYYLRK